MWPIKKEELVKKINKLKPLPEVALKVISIMEGDEKLHFNKLKSLILKDQALTANILRICNSPFYGFSRQITNLSHAIAMIGTKMLRNIVLSATFQNSYKGKITGYSLEEGELAKHSICVGTVAQIISVYTKKEDSETAFVAGLLHDIGKLVIDQFVENRFLVILQRVNSESRPFNEIEEEELGFSHPEIGGMVAVSWRLPEILVDAITYHHDPSALKTGSLLADIVNLADVITVMLGVGCGADGLTTILDENVLDRLNLSEEEVEDIYSSVPDKLNLL